MLIENGDRIFLLFLAPWIGLLLDLICSKKIIRRLSVICVLLLLPMAFGYQFTIPYADRLVILLLGSCGYSLYSGLIRDKGWKAVSAVAFSVFGFIGLGFFAFMNAFSGSELVEKCWHSGKYRVEHIRSQGFSGRAVQKYQLIRYTLIPVYRKTEDEVREESVTGCEIRFTGAGMGFDRCGGKLKSL